MTIYHSITTDSGICFGFDSEDIEVSIPHPASEPSLISSLISWEEWDKLVEFINSNR